MFRKTIPVVRFSVCSTGRTLAGNGSKNGRGVHIEIPRLYSRAALAPEKGILRLFQEIS